MEESRLTWMGTQVYSMSPGTDGRALTHLGGDTGVFYEPWH